MQVGLEHRPFFRLETPVAKLSSNAHFALADSAADESSRVAGIVQNAQHTGVLQETKQQFSGAHALGDSSGPKNALRLEVMDYTHG